MGAVERWATQMVTNSEASEQGVTYLTVFGAARRYWWIVALSTALLGVAALFVQRLSPPQVTAEAAVILEDPATADILNVGNLVSGERRVLNQLEVFRSGIVATRASEIAVSSGIEVDPQTIIEDSVITASRDTDQITVSFSAETREAALGVASAIVAAYREVQFEQTRAESDRVLERLSRATAVLNDSLDEVQRGIFQFRSDRGIDQLSGGLLDQLAEIQAQALIVTDPEQSAALADEIERLGNQIETMQTATVVEDADPELSGLLRSRDQILAQLEDLADRTAEVEVQAETESSGIAFEDPATVTTSQQGAGTLYSVAAGAFLGLLAGLGVAYSVAGRRSNYSDRFEPATVTGLELLADIPTFDVATPVPVRDDPRSLAAESLRFAAGNLQVALDKVGGKTVMFVSTSVGEGKTTLIANAALASARSGLKTLVIDADFGHQQTTALLMGELPMKPGLTELVAGRATLPEARLQVDAGLGSELDLLSRGMMPISAPEFFSAKNLVAVIDRVSDAYDIVLIDGPPLLQVAYSNNVARLAGAVVAVIGHGSSIARSRELADRLRFIDVSVLGYVYNKAPLRRELLESGGSMRDVLGDMGLQAPVPPRQGR